MADPIPSLPDLAADERFRALLDALPLPTVIYDLESFRFLAVNRACLEHYGYGEAEFLALKVTDLRPPQDLERLRALEHHPRPRSTGVWASFKKDGTRIDVEAQAQDVLWRGAHARLVVLKDVTEQLRTQRALAESEEKFRLAFHTSPDAFNLVRIEDGVWVAANLGFTKITGWTEEEIKGKTGAQIGIWVEEHVRERMYQALQRGEEFREVETRFRTKSGGEVTCTLSAQVIVLGGKPHVLAVTRDVTARKQAEAERDKLREELLHAQKMEAVGRLAGGVAHDFNNMMTVIGNYTEFVLADLPEGSPYRADLEQVREAARRATALTAQLLAFSRRQMMQPRLIDASQLVVEVGRLVRRLIGEHIQLSTRLCEEPTPIRVDPGQLEQALVNLVVNGRDAMPGGGRLMIETSRLTAGPAEARLRPGLKPGEHVLIAVTDTGQGMDAETQARAFEPFFTTKGTGTGLGLATVFGIVTQSGGHVWLNSEPGRGTCVQLCFPSAAGAEEKPSRALSGPPPPEVGTVLLVEDEALVRDAVRAALQRSGHRVLVAEDGEAAERIARNETEQIDLLLSDVVMPVQDGPSIARRLLAIRPGLKVLLMSGYTENPSLLAGGLDEGVAFIEKPFSQERLARKVAEVLAGR